MSGLQSHNYQDDDGHDDCYKMKIFRCGGAVYQAEQVLTRAGPCHLLCLACNNCRFDRLVTTIHSKSEFPKFPETDNYLEFSAKNRLRTRKLSSVLGECVISPLNYIQLCLNLK